LNIELQWLGIGAALVVGAIVGALGRRKVAATHLAEAKRVADQILSEAAKEADILRKEAEIQKKDALLEAKTAWEQEAREMRRELQAQEKRLLQREENLDRKVAQIDSRDEETGQREKRIQQQEARIRGWEKEAETLVRRQRERLEELAGLGAEEAKKQLMDQMESEARHECAKAIKQIEDEAKEIADKKAQEVLALAVQRYAGDFVAESAVSVVPLPNDEMKGRIIGREGRNIRAIEAATGTDLIIDDTPEAVIISGFNPVRREVARLALERLIGDGRIHPSRIEEAVGKATQDVDNAIREAGEQATFDVGVHGIHPEIIKLIGRLRYRTSYGQNVLQHSIEVAFLCGIMAAELGINVKQAKRAGLLHDIGKAVDHEVEGSHAVIGANLARKYGESAKIVHALAAHHEDEKPSTVLAVLVQAADALSGARPGARREMLETYVKRLQDLERIGTSFTGVTNCFAIQAGREIRVMVSSEEVSDVQSHALAKQIARQIEEEMTYPGQIKINVIRETRAVEFAK
jgi:ribonuclease Y